MIQQIVSIDNTDLIDHTPFKAGRVKVRRLQAPLRPRPAKPAVGYLNAPGLAKPATVPVLQWMD